VKENDLKLELDNKKYKRIIRSGEVGENRVPKCTSKDLNNLMKAKITNEAPFLSNFDFKYLRVDFAGKGRSGLRCDLYWHNNAAVFLSKLIEDLYENLSEFLKVFSNESES